MPSLSLPSSRAFWFCFRDLDKQEDQLNMIGMNVVEATGYPGHPKKALA